MVSFGAHFGYTVMGRISLAIGRASELLGEGLTPDEYAAVQPRLVSAILAVVVIAGLVVWRMMGGGRKLPDES